MKCLICENEFIIGRCVSNLFKFLNYNCCMECYQKYPMKINEVLIPIKEKIVKVITLFDFDHNINYEGFKFEFDTLYKKLFKDKTRLVICYKKVYLTEYFIKELEAISTLLDKEITILTNVLIT